MVTWRLRARMEGTDIGRRYAGYPTIFSIQLHHGGEFTEFPERKYINGTRRYVDLLDIDTFSVNDIDEMMAELGYTGEDVTKLYYHFQRPFNDLDFGLLALGSDQDIRHLATFVGKHMLIDVYTEHGRKTNMHESPTGELNNDPNLTNQGTVTSSIDLDKNQLQVQQDHPVSCSI